MGRGGWLAVGALAVAGAAGLGVWAWFLAGRSLDVMDQWSSVLSGFGTLASLAVAVIALVVAIRSPETGGSRSVRVGRDANDSRITQGDASPIHDGSRAAPGAGSPARTRRDDGAPTS